MNSTVDPQKLLPEPVNRINYEEVKEDFILWRSIPSLLRMPPPAKNGREIPPRQFAKQLGIDDDRMLALIEIPDQKHFAQKYSVTEKTLSMWNREIVPQRTAEEMRRYWSSPLSRNVLLSLYNRAIQKGMALEVKLWFQLVEGFNERATVDVHHRVIEKVEYEVIEPETYRAAENKSATSTSD